MPQEQQATDIEDYLTQNPHFRQCRTERHIWELLDDGWVQSYNDAIATHEKKSQCPRCKMIRRRRAQVTVKRGRVKSFLRLPTAYNDKECKDYYVKGGNLASADVDQWEIQQLVTAQRPAPNARRVG